MILIFMESEEPEIKSKQASKRDRTLKNKLEISSRFGLSLGEVQNEYLPSYVGQDGKFKPQRRLEMLLILCDLVSDFNQFECIEF